MFLNQFKLSGVCTKISQMLNDKGGIQGFYLNIATIGESYGVYVPIAIQGSSDLKEGQCYEVSGKLKTKYSVNKNDKVSSVAALSVEAITKVVNPLSK